MKPTMPYCELIRLIRQSNIEKNKILEPNYDKIEDQRKKSQLWKYIDKRENKIGFNIDYMGEAYIYEYLIKFGCFSKISWTAGTNDIANPSIILNNGHKYFIHDKGGRFDICSIDFRGNKYYIEVKATMHDQRDAKICPKQQKFASELNNQNQFSILANVTKVLSNHPIITYYLYDIKKEFVEIDIKIDHKDIQLNKKMCTDDPLDDNSVESNIKNPNSEIQSDYDSI